MVSRGWLLIVAGCYAPAPGAGVACGPDQACPEGLVCAQATQTCERSDPGRPDGAMPDGTVPLDQATDAPTVRFLGFDQTSVAGQTTSFTLAEAVPAGSVLVVEVAGRGTTPVTVTDTAGNGWTSAVEADNSTSTAVAAILFSKIGVGLVAGDQITAAVAEANSEARAIAVFSATGLTDLDQMIGARTSGMSPSVTTPGAVTASNEVLFGVIATGFNDPETFVPAPEFVEVAEYGSPLSSGSFAYREAAGISGPQTFSVTTTHGNANHATALATFR